MKNKFSLALLFLFWATYIFIKRYYERLFYETELNKSVSGIIQYKRKENENNPKAYIIKVNNTWYPIDFGLINEINKGDTMKKEKGSNFYTFYGKEQIVTFSFFKPKIFSLSEKGEGKIEVIYR